MMDIFPDKPTWKHFAAFAPWLGVAAVGGWIINELMQDHIVGFIIVVLVVSFVLPLSLLVMFRHDRDMPKESEIEDEWAKEVASWTDV